MVDPPSDVERLAEERAGARRRREFARADELRLAIEEAGWEVVDHPDGFDLRPRRGEPEATPAIEEVDIGRRPGVPAERAAVSVLVDIEGWHDDAARFVASLAAQPPTPGGLQVVAMDRSDSPSVDWLAAWPEPVPVLRPVGERPGYGAARNAALWRATGRVVVLVDTSLELSGDLIAPLVEALADPGVAVVGPFGLVSADLRDYEERTEGDLTAVSGYCLAARRADLLAVGGLREAFAFYRNADIDLSLRLRTAGSEVRRAVAVGADRCRRHRHRAWEATPAEEREQKSRRNMRRVLQRFGARQDLAVG